MNPDEWVTIADAAILAHRRPKTIYDWVRQDRIPTLRTDAGAIFVHGPSVIDAERIIRKRGRPGPRPPGMSTRRAKMLDTDPESRNGERDGREVRPVNDSRRGSAT